MSRPAHALLAVYIDGETKTGKGSASIAIAEALRSQGVHEYYDVAGDFFRRYVAMVRRHLGLGEDGVLPTGSALQAAAQHIYDSGRLFEVDMTLGDLQRPSVSKSVSVLAELSLVQAAGTEWYLASVHQAQAQGADVLVLDGRNPRDRVDEVTTADDSPVTALDLYLTCDPAEAARRTLLAVTGSPTAKQLETERVHIADRRSRDRQRADRPFLLPQTSVAFVPGKLTAAKVVRKSWVRRGEARLPLTITLDNTHLSKPDMLAMVSELAVEAVKFAQRAAAAA